MNVDLRQLHRATFLGAGLFVGELQNGQPFIYQGGVVRVRREDLLSAGAPASPESKQVWEAAMDQLGVQLAAAFATCKSDCEPAPGAMLELSGCQDPSTGDWLLLWRVACFECVTH